MENTADEMENVENCEDCSLGISSYEHHDPSPPRSSSKIEKFARVQPDSACFEMKSIIKQMTKKDLSKVDYLNIKPIFYVEEKKEEVKEVVNLVENGIYTFSNPEVRQK